MGNSSTTCGGCSGKCQKKIHGEKKLESQPFLREPSFTAFPTTTAATSICVGKNPPIAFTDLSKIPSHSSPPTSHFLQSTNPGGISENKADGGNPLEVIISMPACFPDSSPEGTQELPAGPDYENDDFSSAGYSNDNSSVGMMDTRSWESAQEGAPNYPSSVPGMTPSAENHSPTFQSEQTDSLPEKEEVVFRPEDLEFLHPLELSQTRFATGGSRRTVMKAKVRPTGMECAVKTITPYSHTKLKSIGKELNALHKCLCKHEEISHYIVDFYGAFVMHGRIHLALELMDGSLSQLIDYKLVIPEQCFASMIKLLTCGVNYMHRQLHVIHRDLKPSNILFSKTGCIKISDFGASTVLTGSYSNTSEVVGTMLYMSPERLNGDNYSFSADIWSLGMIAIELAQGCLPFDCHEGDDLRKQFRVMSDYFRTSGSPKLSEKKGDALQRYQVTFSSFLASCLQIDPYIRPSAKKLLNQDWIRENTLQEEGLDELRLQDWFTSSNVSI